MSRHDSPGLSTIFFKQNEISVSIVLGKGPLVYKFIDLNKRLRSESGFRRLLGFSHLLKIEVVCVGFRNRTVYVPRVTLAVDSISLHIRSVFDHIVDPF